MSLRTDKKVPSKSYLSHKCTRAMKYIYWTCFYNSKPIYFVQLPHEKDSWSTQLYKKFLLLALSTKSQDRWDFVTFQLYPKTLLSLSPTCTHVPTAVTLGIAGEFAPVCVLSLLLCCGAGCCCVQQPCSPRGGIRKILLRIMKLLWGWIP